MFSLDYIILCLINAIAVVWVIYRVAKDDKQDSTPPPDSSDNDGGISLDDFDPPVLDLPPGVILPQDDQPSKEKREEILL